MKTELVRESGKNIRKTWLLMGGFFIGVILLGWIFSYFFDNQNILYVSAGIAVVMNVLAFWFSDRIVLSMHRARPADRNSYPELHKLVEGLSKKAGLPMPRVYAVADEAPNAFATGRNRERAVICVTTGLMGILSKEELEGVLAHELSHIGNRDILVSTVAVVLAGFIAILSDFFLRSLLFGGRDRDSRAGGVFAIIGVLLAILAPIAATLIQLAISRKREFLADSSGALLSGRSKGLASALLKIHKTALPMRTASNATAHLFIANPFGNLKTSQLRSLFLTHPPVEDRVRALTGGDIM